VVALVRDLADALGRRLQFAHDADLRVEADGCLADILSAVRL
jgi:hypothetical protein